MADQTSCAIGHTPPLRGTPLHRGLSVGILSNGIGEKRCRDVLCIKVNIYKYLHPENVFNPAFTKKK